MSFLPQSEEIGVGVGGEEDTNIDVHTTRGTPIRYLPLDHLYSATSPCSGSSNVMSKKVKARKLSITTTTTTTTNDNDNISDNGEIDSPLDNKKATTSSTVVYPKPPILYVYSRRRKRRSSPTPSFCHSLPGRVHKKRKIGSTELERLGINWNATRNLDGPRLRECRTQIGNSGIDGNNSKCGSVVKLPKLMSESQAVKRWVA